MRAWFAVALVAGCRSDAPAPVVTPPPKDAAVVTDAAAVMIDAPTSEPFSGVSLTGLSDDGTRAILESIPGVKGPRERIAVDLPTMRVAERAPLTEEIPGTKLHRASERTHTGEPLFSLYDGDTLVVGTAGYNGVWRRSGTGFVVLTHQVGMATCFMRVEGTPAKQGWRYCLDPGVALDAALSPRGVWGVWTTRDPLEDFMRVHTWSIANDTPGPVVQDLGVPIVSDGGRVVVRGASDNCEFRGESELVCLRDGRLVVEKL
jgi:hypothetical protein